jgi:hypothetical protein
VSRLRAIAAVALLVLAACGSTERPEGVAERWLLSLDQGAAGAPDRFGGEPAVEAATSVLPDWRTRDPGSIDQAEVGTAVVAESAGTRTASVPFRVETSDGEVVTGTVDEAPCGEDPPGSGWCIRGVELGRGAVALGGTWSAGANGSDWAWAIAVAVLLCGLAVGLLAVVTRRSARATT